MSNQAYLVPASMPSINTIEQTLQEVLRRKFPQFAIQKSEGENSWVLSYPAHGTKIVFWLGDLHLDEDESVPAIVFRHGHSWDFLWWLEREVFVQLWRVFGGYAHDDGIGSISVEKVSHDSYEEYLRWRYREDLTRKPEIYQKIIDSYLQDHRNALPGLSDLW